MSSDRYEAARRLVDAASRPEDLFGKRGQPSGWWTYKELAKALHPDVVASADRDEATVLFQKLSELWGAWNSDGSFELATRKYKYIVKGRLYVGSVANLYASERDGRSVLVKIPRSPKNSDLMDREVKALKALGDDGPYRWFHPHLIETIRHRDKASGIERRVNILTAPEENGWHTLAEVHAAYPALDPRDAAWMWRRLLALLDHSGSKGVVHGAILPDNVLIHPEKHGLMVVGWTYSSVATDGKYSPVPAMVKSYRDWYPPEVAEKKPPNPSTDIYMASKLMAWLMADRVPRPMNAFIRGCALEAQGMRPQGASKLREELDELLERLWGPRKYRAFSMPTK